MKGNDETQQAIRSENDAGEKGNIREERSSKRKGHKSQWPKGMGRGTETSCQKQEVKHGGVDGWQKRGCVGIS